MTMPSTPTAVYMPDAVTRKLVHMPELFSGVPLTRDHVRVVDEAMSRQDAYAGLLLITFNSRGDVIGSGPGSDPNSRVGFIVPAPGGSDSSFLATRSGRAEFAHYLREAVQEITLLDYDIVDPECTRFRLFMHTVLVFADVKRKGNLNPDMTVLATLLPRQAGSRVDVFVIAKDGQTQENAREDSPDFGSALPALTILDRTDVISESEFDAMIFDQSRVDEDNAKPANR